MNYVVFFGREDMTAVKRTVFTSRALSLRVANSIAFVMFLKHPFTYSNTKGKGKVRAAGNGFFIEYEETEDVATPA